MNRFNPSKAKVTLKLASGRLKLLRQKKTTLNELMKREIADLLSKKKEESARIKVEHVIREDFNMEAMEIIELYCELLLARFGLLESMQHCDPAIAEAVNTIIYAAPRSEVKELYDLREQFIKKYGKDFAMAAQENRNDVVNNRIIAKLKVQTPDPLLVNQYLKAIAETFHVEWDGDTKSDAYLVGIDSALLNPQLGRGEGSLQLSYTFPQQFPNQHVTGAVHYDRDHIPTISRIGTSPSPSSVPSPSYTNPGMMSSNKAHSPFNPESYMQTNMMAPAGVYGEKTLPYQINIEGMQSAPQQAYNEHQVSPNLPNFPSIPTKNMSEDHVPPTDEDDGGLPSFDELAKRFEALKRKK